MSAVIHSNQTSGTVQIRAIPASVELHTITVPVNVNITITTA